MAIIRVMRKEFLVFGSPLIGQEEIDEVVDTIRSGWLGPVQKRSGSKKSLPSTSASNTA